MLKVSFVLLIEFIEMVLLVLYPQWLLLLDSTQFLISSDVIFLGILSVHIPLADMDSKTQIAGSILLWPCE